MILLLTGPSGSGKTTLAQRIAAEKSWSYISEDDIWNEIGHDPLELRTDDEQEIVHRIVGERAHALVRREANVVIEFLIYERPARRLYQYRDAFEGAIVRVLRPSLETILERKRIRGRVYDENPDVEGVRRHLGCFEDLDPDWVIDSSDETAEETYERHFAAIVTGAS